MCCKLKPSWVNIPYGKSRQCSIDTLQKWASFTNTWPMSALYNSIPIL